MRGRLQQLLRRTKRNLAEFKELGGYSEIYKYSIEKNDEFWEKLARSRLVWEKDFTEVSDSSFKDGEYSYFYVALWGINFTFLFLFCLISSRCRSKANFLYYFGTFY